LAALFGFGFSLRHKVIKPLGFWQSYCRKDANMRQRDDDLENLASAVLDAGLYIHQHLGPGLLESVYETVLADKLIRQNYHVDRQKPIDIVFDDVKVANGFRADLIINNSLLIELKSVEKLLPVHAKQTATYIRLMDLKLGLLLNFGAATFREGIKRIANNYRGF
jgi:GxxExxY protein